MGSVRSAASETIQPQSDPGYGIAPRGYRLPANIRLGPVRLQIADLERSLEYYQRVLGLRVADRRDASAALAPQGDNTVIVELHARPGAVPVPHQGQGQGRGRGRLGLYHYAILLPDRAALGRFVQHLADLGEYAGMSDHFVSEAVYLTDPDGLGIEVYADRPRAVWQHQDRQLTMMTEPLNVPAVVRAGGGEPWTGMPAGTVMGHVHLFVSDLAQATSFYHDGLGFDKVVWTYPGALFLSAGGYHHHLGTNTWAAGAPLATDEDARLLEWSIILPSRTDVEAAIANLDAAGYRTEGVAGNRTATDPWGTRVRLTHELS